MGIGCGNNLYLPILLQFAVNIHNLPDNLHLFSVDQFLIRFAKIAAPPLHQRG